MVLQRAPRPAKLWGWIIGEGPRAALTVHITLRDVSGTPLQTHIAPVSSLADAAWAVTLRPQEACEDVEIRIEMRDSNSLLLDVVVLRDVAFGDVYLCSGQSNMQISLDHSMNGSLEVDGTIRYPHLRLFTVKMTVSGSELLDVESAAAPVQWARASPTAVSGPDWLSFYSATCYFFGRDLYTALLMSTGSHVPLGLIASSWGATFIDRWTPSDVVPRCAAEAGNQATANPDMWNAMIAPLIPMSLSGFIWYECAIDVL
jgi:sialate O-acetylesterase